MTVYHDHFYQPKNNFFSCVPVSKRIFWFSFSFFAFLWNYCVEERDDFFGVLEFVVFF